MARRASRKQSILGKTKMKIKKKGRRSEEDIFHDRMCEWSRMRTTTVSTKKRMKRDQKREAEEPDFSVRSLVERVLSAI